MTKYASPCMQASKSLFLGLEDKLAAAAGLDSGARATEPRAIPVSFDGPNGLTRLNGQPHGPATALDGLDVDRRITLLPRRWY